MKQLCFATAMLLSAALSQAASGPCSHATVLDEKNGFRESKFGSLRSKYTGLHETEQEQYRTPTVKAYERTGDDLNVFGQPVEHIVYYFFKDRLFLVRLEWSDPAVGSAIISGFSRAVGCEPQVATSGPATKTMLRARGATVSLTAQQTSAANASFGWAMLERLGSEERIEAQIRREAAKQF